MSASLIETYRNIKDEKFEDLYYALSLMCFLKTDYNNDMTEFFLYPLNQEFYTMIESIISNLNISQLEEFCENFNDALEKKDFICHELREKYYDIFRYLLGIPSFRRCYCKLLIEITTTIGSNDEDSFVKRIRAYEQSYICRVIKATTSTASAYNIVLPLLKDNKTRKGIKLFMKTILRDNEIRKRTINIVENNDFICSSNMLLINLTKLFVYSYKTGKIKSKKSINIETLYNRDLCINLGQDRDKYNDNNITFYHESMYLVLKSMDVFYVPLILKRMNLIMDLHDIENRIKNIEEHKNNIESTLNAIFIMEITMAISELKTKMVEIEDDIKEIEKLLDYNTIMCLVDILSEFFLKITPQNSHLITEPLLNIYNTFNKYVLCNDMYVISPNIMNISLQLINTEILQEHCKIDIIDNLSTYIYNILTNAMYSHQESDMYKTISEYSIDVIDTLMTFYINVKKKTKVRYDIIYILNKMFMLEQNSLRHFRFKSTTDKELYIKFVYVLLNDVDNFFEDCISMIKRISEIEPINYVDRTREDILDMQYYSRVLKGKLMFLIKGFEFIEYILVDIIDIFCMPEVIDKFIGSMNNYLKVMIGKDRKQLLIKNKDLYDYSPKSILLKITQIYVKCLYDERLLKSIVYNTHNYNINHFKKMISVITKSMDNNERLFKWEYIDNIQLLISKLNEIESNMDLDDIEIPDEFCDPLMMTLITNPVELPSNDSADKIIMDRLVIKKCLIENSINPFNREPLTLEILDKYNKQEDVVERINIFKTKLSQWKRDALK